MLTYFPGYPSLSGMYNECWHKYRTEERNDVTITCIISPYTTDLFDFIIICDFAITCRANKRYRSTRWTVGVQNKPVVMRTSLRTRFCSSFYLTGESGVQNLGIVSILCDVHTADTAIQACKPPQILLYFIKNLLVGVTWNSQDTAALKSNWQRLL